MKHILSVFLVLLVFTTAYSQSDIDNLIKGSAKDANYLVQGYAAPALNVLGFGLNQGWYNTAAPHKLFGFDLTVTASGISVPTSDLTYRVQNTQLTSIDVITPVPTNGGADVPTIFGANTKPQYQSRTTAEIIDGAPGTDLKSSTPGGMVPVAMVQLGLGLPKGTDLKIRFFPSTKVGSNGSVSMIGFGIMHDIKQHIPGIKKLPFDLSAFVGYTSLKFEAGLNDLKSDQKATLETTAITVQGLISKKISVLTLYGGLGYNFNSSSMAVKGTFDLDNAGVAKVTNPVDFSVSQSGPRITAGLRLKLLIFTFHGDYTLQKYDALTVGFGFNVR